MSDEDKSAPAGPTKTAEASGKVSDKTGDEAGKDSGKAAEDKGKTTEDKGKEGDKDGDRASRQPRPGRSRWWSRLMLILLLLLLLALLLWWRHCLPGKGGGGPASSDGSGMATMSGGSVENAKGEVCDIRVDAKGISVAGKQVSSVEAAVTACGAVKAAHLGVTGDANFGKVEKLEEALVGKGITVQRRR